MSVICYMSVICLVLGGVVRVRLYVIYAHLCNHILLESVVGPGAQLCTLLEGWVLGVGMSTFGAQTVLTPRIGGSKYRWSGACRCLFRSHGLLDWSTLSLSDNKKKHTFQTLVQDHCKKNQIVSFKYIKNNVTFVFACDPNDTNQITIKEVQVLFEKNSLPWRLQGNSGGQLSGGRRCRETGNGIRCNRAGIFRRISGSLWEGLNRT